MRARVRQGEKMTSHRLEWRLFVFTGLLAAAAIADKVVVALHHVPGR